MKTIWTAAAALLLTFAAPAMAQDGPPPPEQVVADNDRNGDKAIDRTEWPAEAPIPYPEDADANKDGKIDVPELAALFQRFLSGELPPPGAPAPSP